MPTSMMDASKVTRFLMGIRPCYMIIDPRFSVNMVQPQDAMQHASASLGRHVQQTVMFVSRGTHRCLMQQVEAP